MVDRPGGVEGQVCAAAGVHAAACREVVGQGACRAGALEDLVAGPGVLTGCCAAQHWQMGGVLRLRRVEVG